MTSPHLCARLWIEHPFEYSGSVKRHVWCSIRHQQPSSPGLLLDWRKDAAGDWEGLVIVLTQSNAHKDYDGTATVWVPARNLRPVEKAERPQP